jgi:hypothetical protein
MNEQGDFFAKLRQIEEVALRAGSDLTDNYALKASLRQIALVARTLRSRIELGDVDVTRRAPRPEEGAAENPVTSVGKFPTRGGT